MTPAEYNKALTVLLHELLADTGFSKKRIGRLRRKAQECEQSFTFYFTRERGLPGNQYLLTFTLSFCFSEVDQLVCQFLGQKYDPGFGTGALPLYCMIPDGSSLQYEYCDDGTDGAKNSLGEFAERVSEDFHAYALSFYDKYNILPKLAAYFDESKRDYYFHEVRSGKPPGSGFGCLRAAVLCLLEEWVALDTFLEETDLLTEEQKQRITDYVEECVC